MPDLSVSLAEPGLGGSRFGTWPEYETVFPGTENPISEGGVWLSGFVATGAWSDMQTTPGLAFGTQTGPVSPPYDDSYAICSRVRGMDLDIEGTVRIANRGSWTGFHEIELLLCMSVAPGEVKCYDALFPMTSVKLELYRMNGPMGVVSGGGGAFTLLAEQSSWPGANDGDGIRATKVGSVITMYHKPAGGSYTAYLTYNTASDGTRYDTGYAGFAHWLNGAGNLSDHGLTWFRARNFV